MAPSAERADPANATPAAGTYDRTARHVVLVGLSGSGKSSVGRRVAKRLRRPGVDADDELERRSGLPVRDWFAERGEAAFRAAELDLLDDLLAAPGPSVIAAGGGVVISPEARALLGDGRATVVFLDASPAFAASRVRAKRGHRPLLDDDPRATLEGLAAEREAWYREVAHAVIPVDPAHRDHDKPKRALADQVADAVRRCEAERRATQP